VGTAAESFDANSHQIHKDKLRGVVYRPRVPRETNPRANEVFVKVGEGREDGRSGGQEGENTYFYAVGIRWWNLAAERKLGHQLQY